MRGKPGGTKFATAQIEDHPRGCGENRVLSALGKRNTGSPPRMRGKHVYHEDGTGIFRITPADAGKTRASFFSSFIFWDHPRGCGENI